jgi:hypothetical protein
MLSRSLALAAFALALHAQVQFNRDIRPIMAETCFRCHGPDRSSRMAGMRLDIREEALNQTARGATPIVPGDPDKSAIVQRIFATGPRIMPPEFSHKTLTLAQKDTIRRWVAEGAKYEGHWAYQPIRRPSADGIDALIGERLAREGLKPSPEADRRTLIRRVTLDLTGLPPTANEIAAFEKDGDYDKLVDRLLASPRYAEQQAMHWLDIVRYADTCGFHGDNAFPAWPYRDYVLRSYRDNKPFDQFTREQLAGDLIPNATPEQKVASAYNRLNRTSAEGGLQPKEYLAKYAADRVRTTVAVWMGSTVGCAECHDHKFDPFTSRDFYSMKAFFADIKETGLVPDRGRNAWGSQITLPSPEQQSRLDALQKELADARARLAETMKTLEPRRAEWEKQLLARYESGELVWQWQRPTSAKSANGAVLTIYNDEPIAMTSYDGSNLTAFRAPGNGLIVASGPNPDNETYSLTMKPGAGTWRSLGVEMVQDESLPGIRLARGADRLVITEIEAESGADDRVWSSAFSAPQQGGRQKPIARATPQPRGRQKPIASPTKLPFISAAANLSNQAAEYLPLGAIDGDPKTAWAANAYNETPKVMLTLRFAEPLTTTAASTLAVRIHQDSEFRRATLGRFRLALSSGEYTAPHPDKGKEIPDAVLKALHTPEDKRTTPQKNAIAAYYEFSSPEAQGPHNDAARLEMAVARLELEIPHAVITEATTSTETRVLPRGNWMDDSGAVVEPAIPAFLGKLDTGSRRATRLDLANWLVSPENPLTARVYVNRVWRQFFGIGLSKVLDDLGSQGEWPTHPELLDWLASEFARDWDVKHLIRTIVTSKTYRQSSMSTPELDERDPDNRLLARQSRFRVDAEVVRDTALYVSGLMEEKFGGPSAKPYQPDGYLATMNFPKREYSASHGADLYRRGVYTFWQRSFLHPSLLTFDAPTREECAINRVNSNTPLQALVLLNDPIYVEAARVFAQQMAKGGIDWGFERAVSRKPTAEEHRILDGLYKTSLAHFRRSPGDAQKLIQEGEAPVASGVAPAELAALTTVARAILNTHETITRN